MAYSDFSIESALVPTTTRTSVKLEGVQNACAVLNSSSKSTEEFIQGAVSSLGNADRMIMYVNGSLEALSDRLQTATKIAKAVNTSKAHGAEGFQNVPMLDPWAYAIEGKATDFFKRIWEAIRTACRRVLDAIAYIIKWVGNAIACADVRGQVKDYKFYKANASRIEKYAKAAKVNDVKFNAPAWNKSAKEFAKIITNAESHYIKSTKSKDKDIMVMENLTRLNLSTLKTKDDFVKAFGKVFGAGESLKVSALNVVHGEANSAAGAYQHLVHSVNSMKDDLKKQLETDIAEVFGKSGKVNGFNTRALVMNVLTSNGGKANVETTVGDMKKRSDDFAVLDETWLSKNVKQAIASVHNHQKEFTQYTKNIDKVAAAFAKTLGDNDNGFKAINNLTAQLANTRIRYNSFWSNLMLEFESAALRYRKSAHIALKHYIRAAQKGGVTEKKSEESLSPESVEALFDFN
jgi:hypothetical protein